ncbi:hypothetical protein N9B82_05705 [Saprospiraceae bacterium]|nr:hypothetical protein [Saprospiraceae bacterium]
MKIRFRILKKPLEDQLRMNRLRFVFGFGIISFGLAYFNPFELSPNQYGIVKIVIWFLAVACLVVIERKMNLKLINKKAIGEIKVNSTKQIEYLSEEKLLKIDLEQIQSLEFRFEGAHGEGSIIQYLYPVYANYYFGTSNQINFQYEGKKYSSYIFIENASEKDMFYSFINYAQEQSINITERTNGKQSYGGNFLSYKEIQKYKEKYRQKED